MQFYKQNIKRKEWKKSRNKNKQILSHSDSLIFMNTDSEIVKAISVKFWMSVVGSSQ
jgi:hypothetical protein